MGRQATEDIDREEQGSEQRKKDKLFHRWLERKGSKATYKELIGVFEGIQNNQAAEAVTALIVSTDKGRHYHFNNDATLLVNNLVY